jgi:small subunit ribosomal protein S9
MVMSKTNETKASKNRTQTAPMAHGVGRRKKSVARIWLRKGSGNVVVNGKPVKDYFTNEVSRIDAVAPFQVIPADFDAVANVVGGGVYSQAGAVKLGIARALVSNDEALRGVLRQHGLLTVDARQKERKKYGQRGARRKFQFVKR